MITIFIDKYRELSLYERAYRRLNADISYARGTRIKLTIINEKYAVSK